jgi:hypothetical protein
VEGNAEERIENKSGIPVGVGIYSMLNAKIGENYNANDVVNSNDLRKRILNIDSRFRSDMSTPSTNFTFKFTHPYKNLIRLRIASVEIPNMIYTFTTWNNSFTIRTHDITGIPRIVLLTIEPGNYTSSELIGTLQNLLDTKLRNPYGIFMSISLNTINAKVTITLDGLSTYPVTAPNPVPTTSGKPFILEFASIDKFKKRHTGFGLGYNLGFRCPIYRVTDETQTTGPPALTTYSITTEACLDVVGNNYMFLCINDLHTVEQKTYGTYLQCLAKIIIREDKYAVIYDDGSSFLSNEIIFPSPVDLKYLEVKLVDPYGDTIDLNCMDFSFSIEITEVLNIRLYDFYRNYIWMGTVPSTKRVQGIATPLLNGTGSPL